MSPFRELLGILRGRQPVPANVQAAADGDPDVADLLAAGLALGASSTPNWEAIIAVILQLLPIILPLL
jgi:hypothetical protein